MDRSEFEKKLFEAFKESDKLDFQEFIIDRFYETHKRARKMAGDLGDALGKLADKV